MRVVEVLSSVAISRGGMHDRASACSCKRIRNGLIESLFVAEFHGRI